MNCLAAVIKLFDPDYQVGSIKAKGALSRPTPFKQGELGRHILDCLRKAGEPQSCPDIVAHVCEAIGQPQAVDALTRTVRANLAYMARHHKTVVKTGDRATARWTLDV